MDISKFSLSKDNEEILLPPMSFFKISKIVKQENEEIVYIYLVKIDKNKSKKVQKIDNSPLTADNCLSLRTIEKEIALLEHEKEINHRDFCFVKDAENFFKIKILINGPKESFYENGIFQINFFLSEGYPNKKPNVKFVTKIFHPNISFDSGDLDDEFIEKIWKPSLSIANFLGILLDLLMEPSDNYRIMDTKAKSEFRKDKRKFGFIALQNTRKYADFSGLISEYMKDFDCGELDARNRLLKEDKFESAI